MNAMCKDCPRYSPGAAPAPGESWYTMHRCPGCDSDTWTGCAKKPWHPLASVLGLVYDVEKETWTNKTQED